MSLNIPEGYELHYSIRKPDGELVTQHGGVMVWSEPEGARQYRDHMAMHLRHAGITEYLAAIEVRLCSPFVSLEAPLTGLIEELERWRKSQEGQQ